MSAAFTAEVESNPRKKNKLNPKRPINPVSEIPFKFFRIILNVGSFLTPKIVNVITPNKKRQNPASIKFTSFNITLAKWKFNPKKNSCYN